MLSLSMNAEMKRRACKRRRRIAPKPRPKPKAKKLRGGEAAVEKKDVDRLSELPDDLLSHIFSALPIKDAVRAAVLSRRWRHAPSLLPRRDNLRIDTSSPPAALDAHHGLIRRCDIQRSSGAAYARCVNAALARGVQELALDHLSPGCGVPPPVLAAASLKVLSLKRCSLPITARVGLAGLRTLKLERVSLCELLLQTIVERCSVLERLHIVYCSGMGAYNISSASIKHLWVRPSRTVWEIDVDTPSLETLTLYTRPRVCRLGLRGPKVRKVFVHLAHSKRRVVMRLGEFLAAAEGLTCLTLRGASLKCLLLKGKIVSFPIPFQILRILSLSVDLKDDFQVSYMVKLLESCPHLRELNISIAQGHQVDTSAPSGKHKKRLQQLECIKNHLEQVKVCGFTSEAYQMELARLLLMKAKKLKKMTIGLPKNCSSEQQAAVKDLLSSSKKASIQRAYSLGDYYCMHIELV